MKMRLQYTVSQHVGSAGGPSVFPEVKKAPWISLSIVKPESADVNQHADFLDTRCFSPSEHL